MMVRTKIMSLNTVKEVSESWYCPLERSLGVTNVLRITQMRSMVSVSSSRLSKETWAEQVKITEVGRGKWRACLVYKEIMWLL